MTASPGPIRRAIRPRSAAGKTAAVVVLGASIVASALVPVAAHAAANPAPQVIPALQTWAGGEGTFTLQASSRIVADPEFAAVAAQFASDLEATTGLALEVVNDGSRAVPGDLVLNYDANLSHAAGGELFRSEGYRLTVGFDVEIAAPTDQGAFYGTRTVLQALVQAPDRAELPVGQSFDWPDYEVRGFMLDVGRRFFTPEFVRDYIAMMSWYKLNEFQIHLNDNEIRRPVGGWVKAYDGFRLKSDNPAFAGLASQDGAYDRADWQSFEDTAKAHAVTIIPEIDAPAHSRSFIRWNPAIGLNSGDSDHLDLSKPEATEAIKAVFDEFTPWFEGSDVHMGTDEYPLAWADDYRTFFNTMADHIRGLGKQPRAWGSMTKMHGSAEGYDREVVINTWNDGWYGMPSARTDGYDFINTNDAELYVVPFAGYYHPNGLENSLLYTSWLPNLRDGKQVVPAGSPKGAMFAVWNDLVHADYTEFDVHGLVRDSFPVIAQKTWKSTTPSLSYTDFVSLQRRIGAGPGLTTIEQTPLTQGAVATASGVESADFPASFAIDGNDATRWSANYVAEPWIAVDLRSPQRFDQVALKWERASAKDYTIAVSNDGKTWSEVAVRSGMADGARTDTVEFDAVAARYVKVTITAKNLKKYLSLFELSIPSTGKPGAEITASVTSRCVAGFAVLAVRAVNGEGAPFSVSFASAFGERSFAVQPGSNAFHAFSTRSVKLPAGTVTLSASTVVDGVDVSTKQVVPYEARSCG